MADESTSRRAIDELLRAALDLPEGDQQTFIDGIPNPEHRRQVERLLEAALEEDNFLPIGGAMRPELLDLLLDESDDDGVGPALGAYRILQPLGQGGMGRVYLGARADGLFERHVAIKVVHRESASSDLYRLLREHHVLAGLVHPHIAQLYDAGMTDDGRPYLVMEYVDGEIIDAYCRRVGLDLKARIGLLIDVCTAVQAAHQMLIVHRDIKPSNILVDRSGAAKLLDFGIARMLDPEATTTGVDDGPLAGSAEPDGDQHEPAATLARSWLTPNYASPEQRAGRLLTTASDVYQLGLLAWELLVGERPPPRDDASSALHPPPSPRIRGDLSGVAGDDLDAVILRALAPKPDDRYPSADRLAEDLRNVRDRRPVSARPATATYQARRFVERHRAGTAATIAGVLLLIGLISAFWLRLAAERDATRVQAEQALAAGRETEQVADFLADLFHSSDPFTPGRSGLAADLSVRELLDRSASRLEHTLIDQPLVRARLLTVLGGIYRQLGHPHDAEPLLREGLRLRETTNGTTPAELAQSWLAVSRLEYILANFEAAEDLVLRSVSFYRGHGDPTLLASALEALGNLQKSRDQPEAIDTLQESLALWQQTGFAGREAVLHSFLAAALINAERNDEAKAHLEQGLALHESIVGPDHPSIAAALVGIADLHTNLRQPLQAIPLLERATAIYQSTFGPEDFRVATATNNLGVAFSQTGDQVRARVHLLAALEGYRRWSPDHPDLGQILNNLGTIDWAEGQPQAAADRYLEALVVLRRTLPDEHIAVSRTVFNLGEAELALGQVARAEEHLQQSLELFVAKFGDNHVMLSWPQLYLAKIANDRGDRSRAKALTRRALDLRVAALGPDAAETREATQALEALER